MCERRLFFGTRGHGVSVMQKAPAGFRRGLTLLGIAPRIVNKFVLRRRQSRPLSGRVPRRENAISMEAQRFSV
jgi:hypothetical protein